MTLLFAANYSEASGPVLDISGNGRSFNLTGTTARGAAGSGYTYGGTRPNVKSISQATSGEVQLGPAITGLNTPARTVATWAKTGPLDPSWFLEYYRAAQDTGVCGWLQLSGVFRARTKDSSNVVHEITPLTKNNPAWEYWAITHDGATLKAYNDDGAGNLVLIGSLACAPVWDADVLRLLDGCGPGLALSETRIYDQALDLTTLDALMDTPVEAATGPGPFTGWGVPL